MTPEQGRKIAAFDAIVAGYLAEGIDDMESEWLQGSFYDNIVTEYLGVPTIFNGLEEDEMVTYRS